MEHKPASVSEATECRITFIIGNGFDLNLQMKTRYADIYESYVTSPSRTSVIAAFKKDLGNYSQCDKWADFEMGMAEYARTLPDENSFVECIRDFKKHMVDYLAVENERIAEKIFSPNNEPRVVFALEKALHHFHERLTPNAMNQIADLWHSTQKSFSFLTFNYTSTLFALNLPLHNNSCMQRGFTVSGYGASIRLIRSLTSEAAPLPLHIFLSNTAISLASDLNRCICSGQNCVSNLRA